MVETEGTDPVTFQGGFIAFPSATFSPDPHGGIRSLPDSTTLTTDQSPALTGTQGGPLTGLPFYDGAAGATVHVVTVATGAERAFSVSANSVGAQTGVALLDYDGRSVYLAGEQMESYPMGVFRLDLGTGKVSRMSQVDNIFAVRDGSAWIGSVDPHDPSPPTAPASVHLYDTLVQVNLTTGAQTTWFYRPGVSVSLLDVDASGRPIVTVNDGPDFLSIAQVELRRLSDPLSGGEDNGELIYAGQLPFLSVQADGDRIWFGDDRGIYVYTPSSGLGKAYSITPRPNVTVFPAGFCG
jgi:hypothetical protein